MISGTRVDPVAPATVREQRPDALLEPQREECLELAGAEAARAVARGKLEERERPDLGDGVVLVNEAELRAQLRVAVPVVSPTAHRVRVLERRDEVELKVWHGAIVHLDMRRREGQVAVAIVAALGREISLEVVVLHGLGIVRHVRWARDRNDRHEAAGAREEHARHGRARGVHALLSPSAARVSTRSIPA